MSSRYCLNKGLFNLKRLESYALQNILRIILERATRLPRVCAQLTSPASLLSME